MRFISLVLLYVFFTVQVAQGWIIGGVQEVAVAGGGGGCSASTSFEELTTAQWLNHASLAAGTFIGMVWGGSTINLCQVDLMLRAADGGLDDLTGINYELRVYNLSGNNFDGAAVYTSGSVSGLTFVTDGIGDWVSFTFSSGTLASGQALVLSRTDSVWDYNAHAELGRDSSASADSNSYGTWSDAGVGSVGTASLTVRIYETI